jgi:hypothetical protein
MYDIWWDVYSILNLTYPDSDFFTPFSEGSPDAPPVTFIEEMEEDDFLGECINPRSMHLNRCFVHSYECLICYESLPPEDDMDDLRCYEELPPEDFMNTKPFKCKFLCR